MEGLVTDDSGFDHYDSMGRLLSCVLLGVLGVGRKPSQAEDARDHLHYDLFEFVRHGSIPAVPVQSVDGATKQRSG